VLTSCVCEAPYIFVVKPGWRNWQTPWIQNPLSERACGFESRPGYSTLTCPQSDRRVTPAYSNRGDQVVWRSRPGGGIASVLPMTVVEDSSELTVLFQAVGSVCKKRTGKRGGPGGRSMLPGGWDGQHVDRVFDVAPTLRLHVHGEGYAVLRQWSFENDRALGWYINLESPWQRTAIEFDSRDSVLDIVVSEDLSSWSWKDRDEFDWSVANGLLSVSEARQIERAAEDVVTQLEAREFPFVDDWSAWRPDGLWPIPEVPDGWDVL
jgi:hypothetical protein